MYRNADPATLRVVERFTQTIAGSASNGRATIERSEHVDAAVDDRDADLARDRGGLLPFECHEGNYGLRNILSGARAADSR